MTKTLGEYIKGKTSKPKSILEDMKDQVPDEWSIEIEITRVFIRMVVYDQDGEQFDYKDLTSNSIDKIFESIQAIKRQR
jgi:hypothetical protein